MSLQSNKAAPFSIQGKTALLTGAGSGICCSFATLLLSRGCNVLIADLTLRPEAQKIVDEYSGKTEGRPRAVYRKTDVTDWQQLKQMFTDTYAEFGSLDICCPGAGVFEPQWSAFWYPPGTPTSKDDVEGGHYKTLDIDLLHPIRTAQLAISHYLNPPSGSTATVKNPKRIIFISSIAAQAPGFPWPLYSVAKAGVSAFTRSLAMLETTHGIRSVAVAPGLIDTPLFRENADKLAVVDEKTDKWVKPEAVAEAMLDLIEDSDTPGGTVVEVGHEYTRRVEVLNDEGPNGRPGTRAGSVKTAVDDALKQLNQPGWGKVE